MNICTRCKGTGHDKGSMPTVIFPEVLQEDGTMKRQHTTLKRGSGCMRCLGVGNVKTS